MMECGVAQHPLDPCLFVRFRRRERPETLDAQALDGILGLHVGNFVGGGEGSEVAASKGFDQSHFADRSFMADLALLAKAFELGSWDFTEEQLFCGARSRQDSNDMTI